MNFKKIADTSSNNRDNENNIELLTNSIVYTTKK